METIFDGAEDQKDLKIIIFTSTKSMCDDLTSDLRYKLRLTFYTPFCFIAWKKKKIC